MSAAYSARVDRDHPALFVFLVDQSESMDEVTPGGSQSKAELVAGQLNSLLYELVLRCVKVPREPPRSYISFAVIGYGGDGDDYGARSLLPRSLPDGIASAPMLAEAPRRIAEFASGNGMVVRRPVWVEPRAAGGTPMCAALHHAGALMARWTAQHPAATPPTLVNLTDGESTDGDPSVWFRRMTRLGSADGAVLAFNLLFDSAERASLMFPSTVEPALSPYAQALWSMSSELPATHLELSRGMGLAAGPGARGFVLNADARALASFLNIGTGVARGALG